MSRYYAFAWTEWRTRLAYRLGTPLAVVASVFAVYAIQALERHGAVVGSGLAGWRILRCNPWCHGGCDEVPDNMPWSRAKASPSAHPPTGPFTGLLQRDSGSVPAAAAPTTAATDKTNH